MDFSWSLYDLVIFSGGFSFGYYLLFLGLEERLHFPGFTNATMILGYIIILIDVIISIWVFGIIFGIISTIISLLIALLCRRFNIPFFHR